MKIYGDVDGLIGILDKYKDDDKLTRCYIELTNYASLPEHELPPGTIPLLDQTYKKYSIDDNPTKFIEEFRIGLKELIKD